VAAGIIAATEQMDIKVPIVVRLTGTNEERALEMLAGTKLVAAATMDEAVQKAIELTS
jgi:succinyl-CoA synthetase beta subunit